MDNPTKIIVTLSMDAQTGEISFFKGGEFYKTGRSDNPELWDDLLAYCKDWKSADQIKNDELLGELVESNPDKVLELVQGWVPGIWVKTGSLVRDGNVIYTVRQGHDTQENRRPGGEGLDALWTNPIPVDAPEDAVAEFGFWLDGTKRELGAHPYGAGEKAAENGQAYECIINATVWPPSVLPNHWRLVE